MDCQQGQDWLLQAEDPRPESCLLPELADHVRTCPTCRGLSVDLLQLEQAWREIPVPASADQARQVFLEQLQALSPAPPPVAVRPRCWLSRRLLLAASLLLAAGVGLWGLFPVSRPLASSEVVDSLLDWNLELAQTSSLAERTRLFAAEEAAFQGLIREAGLVGEERELADKLLENGAWLAVNDDPMGQADRFSDMADQLLERMKGASKRGNVRDLRRVAHRYRQLVEYGIDPTLEKVQASAGFNFERKQRFDRARRRHVDRRKTLDSLLERAPEATRQEFRKPPRGFRKTHHKGASATTPR